MASGCYLACLVFVVVAPMSSLASVHTRHIVRLSVAELRPGMYIHDLGRSWLQHPFWRRRFTVGEREIERLREEGIDEVWVDTRRGTAPEAPPTAPALVPSPRITARELIDRRLRTAREQMSLEEERWRMRHFRIAAATRLKPVFAAAREGQPPELATLQPIIDRLIESVLRHPDALIPLLRLKPAGDYAVWHGLACAALTVAIAHAAGAEADELWPAACGALLMDIGLGAQAALDAPRPLEPGERRQLQAHVPASVALLADMIDVHPTMLEIAAQHHERLDGSGYPLGLRGTAINPWARVAALADCYDALVSARPWRAAYAPTEALALIGQGAGRLFCPRLSQALVDAVGVFPVGSLVRLAQPDDQGDVLAVVLAQRRGHLAQPVVRLIYDVSERRYLRPIVIDLARRRGAPVIVGVESWRDWGLDEARWQPQ